MCLLSKNKKLQLKKLKKIKLNGNVENVNSQKSILGYFFFLFNFIELFKKIISLFIFIRKIVYKLILLKTRKVVLLVLLRAQQKKNLNTDINEN